MAAREAMRCDPRARPPGVARSWWRDRPVGIHRGRPYACARAPAPAAIVSALTHAVLARPIEREDDLSLFFWLVRELERVEARPDAGNHAGAEAAERRARESCHAAAAVVARPAKTDRAV